MRILIINNSVGANGGVETYVSQSIAEFLKKGHHVALAGCGKHHGAETQYVEDPDGITERRRYAVYTIKNSGKKACWAAVIRYFWNKEVFWRLDEILNIEKPDIVHIHNILYNISISALYACWWQQIPAVMHIHEGTLFFGVTSLGDKRISDMIECRNGKELDVIKTLEKTYTRQSIRRIVMCCERAFRNLTGQYRHVGCYIVPSRSLERLCHREGFPRGRVLWLPHAVERPTVERTKAETRPHFLYVGRLSGEKGVGSLIKAYRVVKALGALHIVGDGPERAEYETLARKLNLNDVRFTGRLSGEELENEDRSALCCVVPSVCFEGFGLTVLEAYRYNIPVVGADVGGLRETIVAGKTGWLFRVGDQHDLSEKLKIAGDRERKKFLATDLLSEIDSAYSDVGGHYQKLEDLYKAIIDDNSKQISLVL